MQFVKLFRNGDYMKVRNLILASITLLSACQTPFGKTQRNSLVEAVSAGTSGITITSSLNITQFNPPSGSLSAAPTSFTVDFNETNLDSSSSTLTSNYTLACGANTYHPNSVIANSTSEIAVTFANNIVATNGTTCTFTVGNAVKDTSGNFLTGGNSASYTINIVSSTLTVTQFNPDSGTVTSVPTSIIVDFNETNLDQSTATLPSNYTMVCGANSYTPSSVVTRSSSEVGISFPNSMVAPSGSTCNFTVGAGIKDLAGNYISGTRVVNYFMPVVDPLPDTWAPIGTLLSPLPNDRLFGYVTLSAQAVDQGTYQSGVAYVQFNIDGNNVGQVSTSPYQLIYNTAALSNGVHTINISVFDNAGNSVTNIDGRQVTFANYSLATSPAIGGNGGSSFSSSAPDGYNLSEIYVLSGSYVNQVTPVWQTAFGNTSTMATNGSFGGNSGSSHTLACPSSDYRIVGIFGTAGIYVDSLGIYCENMKDATQTYTSPSAFGGAGGVAFNLVCPVGTFVTNVSGKAGAWIDQLSISCK